MEEVEREQGKAPWSYGDSEEPHPVTPQPENGRRMARPAQSAESRESIPVQTPGTATSNGDAASQREMINAIGDIAKNFEGAMSKLTEMHREGLSERSERPRKREREDESAGDAERDYETTDKFQTMFSS